MRILEINECELPEGWERKRLGELVVLNYGKGLPAQVRKEGRIPVYGSNGIVGWHNQPLIRFPTIIVGRKGTVGAIHYIAEPCYPIDTTYYITIKNGIKAEIKFLYYLLKSINLAEMDTSTAIPGLNRNDIYLLDVPIPSFEIQKKIVVKLDAFFEHYNEVKKQHEMEKSKVNKIMQAAIGKMIPNPKGELLEGWRIRNFVDCLSKNTYSLSKIKIPTSQYLKNGRFPIIDQGQDFIAGYCNDETNVLQYNSPIIIFGDHTKILKYVDFPFCVGADGVRILIPNKEIIPKFFYYNLLLVAKSLDERGYSRNYRYLVEKQLTVPPFRIQHKIVAKLDAIYGELIHALQELERKNHAIELLPKMVLRKAFNGELIS